jgi:peptidoglycan/LPS O-acetylase OafA/YrhL
VERIPRRTRWSAEASVGCLTFVFEAMFPTAGRIERMMRITTGIGSLTGSSFRPSAGRNLGGAVVAAREPKTRDAVVSTTRNEMIDVVRLFAAASVVFVHASKTITLAPFCHSLRFAVPFFLFASLYYQSLSLRRNPDRPLRTYIWSRFKRLYLPFLAWSVIYLLARDAKRLALLDVSAIQLHPAMLWTGTEYHLYFLPLLLAFSIILASVHWALLRHHRAWRWPLIALAIAAGLLVAQAHVPSSWDEQFVLVNGKSLTDNPTYAFMWGWRGLPAALWGLAFAWFMTAGPVVYGVSLSVGTAGLALAVVCSIWQVRYGIQLIPRALTGLGTILPALAPWKWSGPTFFLLARWGRYGYGIYLCHVLVVEAVRSMVARLLPNDATVPVDLAIFGLGFLGSVVLVLLLSKSPRLAWLNG